MHSEKYIISSTPSLCEKAEFDGFNPPVSTVELEPLELWVLLAAEPVAPVEAKADGAVSVVVGAFANASCAGRAWVRRNAPYKTAATTYESEVPADDRPRVAGDGHQFAVRRLVEVAERRAVLSTRGVVAHGLDELVPSTVRRHGSCRPDLPIYVHGGKVSVDFHLEARMTEAYRTWCSWYECRAEDQMRLSRIC